MDPAGKRPFPPALLFGIALLICGIAMLLVPGMVTP